MVLRIGPTGLLAIFLAGLSSFLAVGWYWERRNNAPLREKVALLERLDTTLQGYCEGVERVNAVCEGQWIEIMQRLGLDDEMMPLVTTALWKRATNGMRVSVARKVLGAKPYATGFLERKRLDLEAVGGPSDDEDEKRYPLPVQEQQP